MQHDIWEIQKVSCEMLHISQYVSQQNQVHQSSPYVHVFPGVQSGGGSDGVLWRSYTRGSAHRARAGVRKPLQREEVLLQHPLRPARVAGCDSVFPAAALELCLNGSHICWRIPSLLKACGGFGAGCHLTGNPVRAFHVSFHRFVIASYFREQPFSPLLTWESFVFGFASYLVPPRNFQEPPVWYLDFFIYS